MRYSVRAGSKSGPRLNQNQTQNPLPYFLNVLINLHLCTKSDFFFCIATVVTQKPSLNIVGEKEHLDYLTLIGLDRHIKGKRLHSPNFTILHIVNI